MGKELELAPGIQGRREPEGTLGEGLAAQSRGEHLKQTERFLPFGKPVAPRKTWRLGYRLL